MSINCELQSHKKKKKLLVRMNINLNNKKHKSQKIHSCSQEYRLWMKKQKLIEVCFTELHDDLILLKIINFHNYVR